MSTLRQQDSFLPPRWVISLVVLVLLAWLFVALKELIVLLVVAYSMAYAIDPFLRYMTVKGATRSFGVLVVFIMMVAILILLGLTAVPTLVDEYMRLTANMDQYISLAKERLADLLKFSQAYLPARYRGQSIETTINNAVPTMTSLVNGVSVNKVISAVLATLIHGYSLTLTIVNLAILPFIVFYLAVDLPRFHAWVLSLFPIVKREYVASLFGEIDSYVSAFVRGQLTVCAILFVLYSIGLGLVGVELWFLLAVISGFGNMIPYIGFLTGIVLSTVLALVTFGDFSHVLLTWGVFAFVQFLEGTFITPRVMGGSVGLHPLLVLLALVAGGQLFGILGVFLAIPVAASLRVLLSHCHEWVISNA